MRTIQAPYTKPGRLSDVLALIQVLSLDPHTRRGEESVSKDIGGNPVSAKTWYALAEEHREFFRVVDKSGEGLSLIARYVLPVGEAEKRPPLSSDFVSTLMQNAINLHDRQVSASEKWKSYVPLWSALIAGVLATVSTLCTMYLTHHFSN